jgi:branched-chain amino acid transport system substrate-binding protein
VAEHGDTVAGRKVELILRDDQTAPDVAARQARELVANNKVSVLTGFATSPAALAAAPYSTQSKTPMVIMNAAVSSIVSKDRPYVVRASLTQTQASVVMAEWAFKHDIKKVVTLVSDYGPGIDSEKFFVDGFKANGGQIVESLRVPMASVDFSAALQRVYDLKPDAVFIFVPGSSSSVPLVKQFMERGLDKLGVKIIAPGDLTDDDQLNNMGDGMIGVITAHHYSADHPSELNKKYVAAFMKANPFRPDFFSVGGYDGMHVIYEAIKATKGVGNGDALVAAMRGMKWESPRGPISIDPETGDIVQNIYLRRVEKKNGQLWNVEFDVVKDVKDPAKAK